MEPIDNQIKLKYRWRQTWPDRDNDFVGTDPDRLDQFGNPVTIGRFYLGYVGTVEMWRWFVQYQPGPVGIVLPSGHCDSPREAAKQIEEAYDALIASAGSTGG